MTWEEIPGWFFWRDGQQQAVRELPDGATIVETGLYLGRSICSLGELVKQSGKRIRVVGVDWCRGSGVENGRDNHAEAVGRGGGTLAGELHRNVLACGLGDIVTLVIDDTVRAASLFADGSLDWVHHDAAHDYDSVRRDLFAWGPKVRKGGWQSGDDYIAGIWPGVVRAVNELLPNAKPWLFNQWLYVKE